MSADKSFTPDAGRTISFTVFTRLSNTAASSKHGRTLRSSWSNLVRLLAAGSKASKKEALGGWCPAEFKHGHRAVEDLIHADCIAFDVDNKQPGKKGEPDRMVEKPTTVEQVLAALPGLEVFFYTSFSHRPEWPRFRFVLPLSRPVNASEYYAVWAALANELATHEIELDPQPKDPARFWYLGSRALPTFETKHQEGRWLDVAPYLAAATAEAELAPRPPKRGEATDDRVQKYLAKCPAAVSGKGGHETAWSVIRCVVRGFDLGEDVALRALAAWNNRCDPAWSEKELRHKIRQAKRVGRSPEIGEYLAKQVAGKGRELYVPSHEELEAMGVYELDEPGLKITTVANLEDEPANENSQGEDQPKRRNLTDLGNAERLRDRHGENIRFVTSWGMWVRWDGRRWQNDPKAIGLRALAQETVRSIYGEADVEADPKTKAALYTWAKASESTKHLSAMLKEAEALAGMQVSHEVFDRDRYALNVLNGTLSLKTGELRPHRREDFITKIAPVAYNADADCSLFRACLEKSQPDPEMRAYLLRAWGYSLTGDIGEHVFFVHYGRRGRNGKGTLMNSVAKILGDYGASSVPPEIIVDTGGNEHPTGLTKLHGRRFCITSETEKAKKLKVALIKRLTGGDDISARRMREDHWEFEPTHKLHVPTNHKPSIPESPDDPIWERVHLVPWTVKIPPGERILNLDEKLQKEGAEGILAEVVRGCLDWQRQRLNPPLAVRAAVEEYRDESDVLQQFIDECLLLDAEAQVEVGHLYAEYRRWAESQGLDHPLTKITLGKALKEREIGTAGKDSKTSQAVRFGVRIRVSEDAARRAKLQAEAEEELARYGIDRAITDDVGLDDEGRDFTDPAWGVTKH